MTKRTAGHQLIKDGDLSSGDEDGGGHGGAGKDIPVSQRVISRPVSRVARREGGGSGNPFKDLRVQKTAPMGHDTVGHLERNALVNLKALNSHFLKAVEEALAKDTYIDLSGLFEQYQRHRLALEQQFDLGEQTRADKLNLGFAPKKAPAHPTVEPAARPAEAAAFRTPEIRPVSVNLPSFAVKEAPPTPVIVEDKPERGRLDENPSLFSFPSPQTQLPPPGSGKGGFSFPSVTSLPAFGTSAHTTSKPLFNFGPTDEPPKPAFKFEPAAAPTPFSFPSASPFTFGPPAGPTMEPSRNEDDADGDDAVPPGEEDSFSSIRTNDGLIMTGEGEEAEEELFAPLRSKLFIYDAAHSAWADLGIALVKINRQKDRPARTRVLCRAEGSGRVLLNAFLDAKVCTTQYSAGKKEVMLTCFNQDSRLAKYLIRTKEPAQALSLHDTISQQLQ